MSVIASLRLRSVHCPVDCLYERCFLFVTYTSV
uniref:Uncharacterized protein n=1 Tax=Rhizophora mucronata TaxID=61149 RepID=A0A2P2QD13_RHIMU